MILQQILYFFNILCLCAGAVSITLSIIYHKRNHIFWVKFFIIFLISFTALFLLNTLRLFYNIVPTAYVSIINNVMNTMMFVALAFLFYFTPFFTTWIIELPWRAPYSILYAIFTALYLALSILQVVFHKISIVQRSMHLALFLSFMASILFCVGVVIKNRERIKDDAIRRLIMFFSVLSVAFCPVICVEAWLSFTNDFNYTDFLPPGSFTFPLYYFWFTLLVLIYLIDHFMHLDTPSSNGLSNAKMEKFGITGREKEIIDEMQKGLTYKEIGETLCISAHTVNNHVANIYGKVNVKNRIDLIRELT